MRLRVRSDVGRGVVEVIWANGDRYYGKGNLVFVRAAISRFIRGRRS